MWGFSLCGLLGASSGTSHSHKPAALHTFTGPFLCAEFGGRTSVELPKFFPRVVNVCVPTPLGLSRLGGASKWLWCSNALNS